MTATTHPVTLFGIGSALVSVSDAAEARTIGTTLRRRLGAQVTSVVPAAETVLVNGGAALSGVALLVAVTDALAHAAAEKTVSVGRTVVLPVRYDGADLTDVADLLGVSADEVVARHTAPEYTVDFLGFAPGFPYLSGLDPFLSDVPRLGAPRTRVPAGSVGLAAGKTCVYPTASPGGWRLLGSTGLRLFDPHNDTAPTALIPGDTVRFEAVR